MFFCEICEIFKSTYFEENLIKTALFVSPQNTIANSIDEFGLDETSHSAKQVFFFLNVIILFVQIQPYHLYIS